MLEDYYRRIALAAMVILFAAICLMNNGCQSWHYERFEIVNGKPVKVLDAGGSSWIMESSIDNVHVEVDDEGTRYLSIGKVTFDPDEEATEALIKGLVEGVTKKVLGL